MIRVANIKYNDIANGPGIRVSLYVQGCEHKCKGCFSQITWDYNKGNEMTRSELYNILIENIYKSDIKRGFSLLGGEPLDITHPEKLKEITTLCSCLKIKDINIWCWTGYLWEDVKDLEIMNYIDVLVDGPFKQEQKDLKLKWCGSSNQRVIDVKKSLAAGRVILYKE